MNTRIKQYLSERDRGITLALILLVLIVYLPSISNPLFFDDFNFINAKFIEDLSKSFSILSLRSISNLTLWWTWSTFNNFPHVYRLTNIIIHIANVLLVFHLAKALLKLLSSNEESSKHTNHAWIAAAFFACNPVTTYAVGYIAQRGILLALMFVLSMQLAFLKAISSKNIVWFVLTGVCYFFAVLSKEHSITAPLLLVAISLASYKKLAFPIKQTIGLFCVMGLLGCYVILKSKGVIGTAYEIDAPTLLNGSSAAMSNQELLFLRSIATQTGLYFKYLGIWLAPIPNQMAFDLREVIIDKAWNTKFAVSILAFATYMAACILCILKSRQHTLVALVMLSPAIMYLTELSTIRVQEPFVLYRAYLWMPLFMLSISLALESLGVRHRVLCIGSVILLILMMAISKEKLHIMSDHLLIWNESISHLKSDNTPGASRMYFNRGNAYLQNKMWQEAISDYEKVIQHDSSFSAPYAYTGMAYINLRNYERAAFYLKKSLSLKPDVAENHFLLAIALGNLGMIEDANEEMKKSCNYGKSLACYFSKEK